MKKWLLLAATSCTIMNAQANQFHCDYKDYFRLSDDSHPAIYITGGSSDYDVYLQIVGPRSFLIRDSTCKPGYAHVTVAYDAYNWCVLDIKNGPWMNHPTVNASCNGIRYISTDYDGFGTHSYTINLD